MNDKVREAFYEYYEDSFVEDFTDFEIFKAAYHIHDGVICEVRDAMDDFLKDLTCRAGIHNEGGTIEVGNGKLHRFRQAITKLNGILGDEQP